MESKSTEVVPTSLREAVEETLEEVLMLTSLVAALGELTDGPICHPATEQAGELH